MIFFPNAKINLGLNITSKRKDGFHNIETCFLPIKLSDILEFIEVKEKTSISSSGISIPGNLNDNLCIRAWQILHERYKIPQIKIHLHKVIPIGAGLGGGSSDAAFMLKGLNKYFKLNISTKELLEIASQLGSDCSFFILNKPSFAKGKGEIIEPIFLNLSEYKLALINPGIHIDTTEAYSNVVPFKPKISIRDILKEPLPTWKKLLINDFEENIFKSYPLIGNIKEKLYEMGAIYASMSGSGSTIFAFFQKHIPKQFSKEFKNYLTWIIPN